MDPEDGRFVTHFIISLKWKRHNHYGDRTQTRSFGLYGWMSDKNDEREDEFREPVNLGNLWGQEWYCGFMLKTS